MYETAKLSVKFPDKNQCGDAVSVIDKDKFVLLVLADGVSSCSNDHLASEKLIEFVEDTFGHDEHDIQKNIIYSIRQSNLKLNSFAGSKSLLSTLVILYWEKGSNEVHYASIGDSRLYLKDKKEIRSLTKDDSINIKGKNFVTQVMGIQDDLSSQYGKIEIGVNDMLLLTSDGFHELSNFGSLIDHLYHSQDLQSTLYENKNEISSINNDDASVIVFRISDKYNDSEICRECLENNNDYKTKDIPVKQILEFIQDEFLKSNDETVMLSIVNYIIDFELHYSREVLIAMLEKSIKVNSADLVNIFRNLIKRN